MKKRQSGLSAAGIIGTMGKTADHDSGSLTYRDAGVDIDAANLLVERIKAHAAGTARPGSDAALGGFGGLFDLKAAGYDDPVLIAANDGVGTKLRIAIETGRHDTVGIDLVAMCVNDLVVQGGEPLFFLDYFACGRLDPAVAERVVAGIAEGCRQAGAALIGGETAEMPGMYADGDYDLAGFAVGAVERDRVLPRGDIVPGDVVLGLASSGPHSNGYSLIRRIVERERLAYDAAAPFQPDTTLGAALLEPTRIYVRPVLDAIRETGAVKALAHITGGGFVENLPRVLPAGLAVRIDAPAIEVPAVFSWLSAAGGIADDEMLKTFNCGIGMVVVADSAAADQVTAVLRDRGEQVTQLGSVIARTGDAVEIAGTLKLER